MANVKPNKQQTAQKIDVQITLHTAVADGGYFPQLPACSSAFSFLFCFSPLVFCSRCVSKFRRRADGVSCLHLSTPQGLRGPRADRLANFKAADLEPFREFTFAVSFQEPDFTSECLTPSASAPRRRRKTEFLFI